MDLWSANVNYWKIFPEKLTCSELLMNIINPPTAIFFFLLNFIEGHFSWIWQNTSISIDINIQILLFRRVQAHLSSVHWLSQMKNLLFFAIWRHIEKNINRSCCGFCKLFFMFLTLAVSLWMGTCVGFRPAQLHVFFAVICKIYMTAYEIVGKHEWNLKINSFKSL